MTIYKGWNVTVHFWKDSEDEDSTIVTSTVSSLSTEINRDTSAFYAMGSSTPVELVKSVYDISASLDLVYPYSDSDPNRITNMINESNSSINIRIIYPEDATSCTDNGDSTYTHSAVNILLEDCEIKSVSIDITSDDFVKMSLDIIAKNITFATTYTDKIACP